MSRMENKVSLNNNGGGDEDGWTFWTRVYSDPKLRTEMDEASSAAGYSTVTEVLSEKTLERTRVVIENLPKSCTEEEIRNLLEGSLGSAKVMKVIFAPRRASRVTVEFYVAADAEEAVERFNGYRLRNEHLRVWNTAHSSFSPSVSSSDVWKGEVEPPLASSSLCGCDEEEEGAGDQSRSETPLRPDRRQDRGGDGSLASDWMKVEESECSFFSVGEERSWDWDADGEESFSTRVGEEEEEGGPLDSTTDENEDSGDKANHEHFILELQEFLRRKGPLEYSDPRVEDFLRERASPSVHLSFSLWPLGAFRIQRGLRLVGKFICVEEDEDLAVSSCDGLDEPLMHKECWEPHSPLNIRSWEHMAQYFEGLLEHFGPLWMDDVRLWYFVESLSPEWRSTVSVRSLDECLRPHSPRSAGVLLMGDTFYLVTDFQHRREVARALRDGHACLDQDFLLFPQAILQEIRLPSLPHPTTIPHPDDIDTFPS